MGLDAEEFEKTIISPIKHTIALTIDSVKDKLNKQNRQFCFEIFGFDYLVDKN